jgi:hypothetical protein
MQDMVVWARKRHPRWGPRKLRARLVRLHPAREFPSASAMASILKRHGLAAVRRQRVNGETFPSRSDSDPIHHARGRRCTFAQAEVAIVIAMIRAATG